MALVHQVEPPVVIREVAGSRPAGHPNNGGLVERLMTPSWKGGGSGNPWPRWFKSHTPLQIKESTCKSCFVARKYLGAVVYTGATAVSRKRFNQSRSADQKRREIFEKKLMEKWLSGLRHSPAKGAVTERWPEGSNPSFSASSTRVWSQ